MDINHLCGQDFTISSQGGLTTVSGPTEGQQRVLRRLLTNLTSYFWHLDYGAGLPTYLGNPTVIQAIQAAIFAQMKLEASVVQSPPPKVTVFADETNTVIANITYVDSESDLTSLLVIPIG